MRLNPRRALALYALTLVAAFLTMVWSAPAARADVLGTGTPALVSVGGPVERELSTGTQPG